MPKKLYNEPSPLETRVVSKRFGLENSESLDTYLANDGFVAFKKAKEMTREAIIDEVKVSSLRGRGGAGFPTGLKWSFVPHNSPNPRVIVINADESEPGTCKDRLLMEYDPHQMIEGVLIASLAVDAHVGYIYVRGEYRYLIEVLDRAIEEAYAKGYLGKNIAGTGWNFDLYTHSGAGAYECGEETALLDSLEGKTGKPRFKPPFPAAFGVYGMPTTINNTQSFASVPTLLRKGPQWFAELGPKNSGGTAIFSVSGHVNRPGNFELPLGIPFADLLELAGGVLGGRKLKAVIPGGSSTPVVPGEIMLKTNMDYDSVKAVGSGIGSAGVIVMDESTCMVRVLERLSRFYMAESCGQCTPCREGTGWLVRMLRRMLAGEARREDLGLLLDVANRIEGHTICGLGDAAAWPVQSFLKHFRHEFEFMIDHGGRSIVGAERVAA
jgi:NADH-quinone oxidoreductase subunit F